MSVKTLRIYKSFNDKFPVEVAFEESLTASQIIPLLRIQESNTSSNKFGLMIQSNPRTIKWIPDDVEFKRLLIKDSDIIFAEPLVKLVNVILPNDSSEYIALEMNSPSESVVEKICMFFNIWPHQIWNIFINDKNQQCMFIPGISLAEQYPNVSVVFLRQTNFSPLITAKIAYPLNIYISQYRKMILSNEFILSPQDISFLKSFKWYNEKKPKVDMAKSNAEKVNEFNQLTSLNGFGSMNYVSRISILKDDSKVSDQLVRIFSVSHSSIASYLSMNSDPEMVYSFSTIFGYTVTGPYLRIFLNDRGTDSWCIFSSHAREILAIIESYTCMKSVTPRPAQFTTGIIVSRKIIVEEKPHAIQTDYEIDPEESIRQCLQYINDSIEHCKTSSSSGSYDIDSVRNWISLGSMYDEAKAFVNEEMDMDVLTSINHIGSKLESMNKPCTQEDLLQSLSELHEESLKVNFNRSDSSDDFSEVEMSENSDSYIISHHITTDKQANETKNDNESELFTPKKAKIELKPLPPYSLKLDELNTPPPSSGPLSLSKIQPLNSDIINPTSPSGLMNINLPLTPSKFEIPNNEFIISQKSPETSNIQPTNIDNVVKQISSTSSPSKSIAIKPKSNNQIIPTPDINNAKAAEIVDNTNSLAMKFKSDAKANDVNASPKVEFAEVKKANINNTIDSVTPNIINNSSQNIQPKANDNITKAREFENNNSTRIITRKPNNKQFDDNQLYHSAVQQQQYITQPLMNDQYISQQMNMRPGINRQPMYMDVSSQQLMSPYNTQIPMQYGVYGPIPYGINVPASPSQSPVNVRVCIDNSKSLNKKGAREKLTFESSDEEFETSSDETDSNITKKSSRRSVEKSMKKSDFKGMSLNDLIDEVEESVDMIGRSVEVGGNVKSNQKSLMKLINELKSRSEESNDKENLENLIFSAEKVANSKSLSKPKLSKFTQQIQSSIADLRNPHKPSKLTRRPLRDRRKETTKQFVFEDAETDAARVQGQDDSPEIRMSLNNLASSILDATTAFNTQ